MLYMLGSCVAVGVGLGGGVREGVYVGSGVQVGGSSDIAVALGTGSVADSWGWGAAGRFNNPQELVARIITVDRSNTIFFIVLQILIVSQVHETSIIITRLSDLVNLKIKTTRKWYVFSLFMSLRGHPESCDE